eukprot:12932546-Prorocentrum_lima.AAC.1
MVATSRKSRQRDGRRQLEQHCLSLQEDLREWEHWWKAFPLQASGSSPSGTLMADVQEPYGTDGLANQR